MACSDVCFYAPATSARRGHTVFGLSVHAYVSSSVDQVKIFVQGRISRPINGSKLIFHMRMYLCEIRKNIQEPWPHDLCFTILWLWFFARLSRLRFLSKGESSTNGSKLVFHMRMYLYETSRNIQETWPHDLYFTVCWLQTLAKSSRLRFLSKIES